MTGSSNGHTRKWKAHFLLVDMTVAMATSISSHEKDKNDIFTAVRDEDITF